METRHYINRYREHYDEILQCERETGFNSEYSMGKWEFIAKERGGGQCMENKRKHQGYGGFWLNQSNRSKRILAKDG